MSTLGLGLRENDYLIAAVLLVLMITVYAISKKLAMNQTRQHIKWDIGEALVLGMMISLVFLVFVFLRPIRQFIYFQF